MKITNRNSQETTFNNIPVTGGFLYKGDVFVKILLPDGKPAALELSTGNTSVVKATVFVTAVELEVIYS